MRDGVHDVTQPCAYAKRPWLVIPSTADSRSRHFDDFGPVLVSHARIGSAVPRGHQPDQRASLSHEPHPL
jgi:hypothetical protein